MLIYDNKAFNEGSRNNYIALGSFDGLHLGHLSLVRKVRELAIKNGGKSIVFTFKNHPRAFINNNNLELIMTNEEKLKVLECENINVVAFKDFDENIMKISPEDFVEWLCESYNVKGIVVGFNFKFGYKNLIKLVSSAWTDGFYTKPRVDHEILAECSEGLIALSGCLFGEVAKSILARDFENAEKTAV